ncbi:MAG: hypothetical protein C4523_02660 [Myxococcales bacterium]|jgi:hypothetical protein|nr:MAG: hypothetical protein C4523_02660 [Myxococcales bacterium]
MKYSDDLAGFFWVAVAVTCLVAIVTHIYVTVATNYAALLILGLVFPPVGVVHGIGIWFGWW